MNTVQPLAPELAAIGAAWRAAEIPDLYEGCLTHTGAEVSRERGRNVRGVFYPKPKLPVGRVQNVVIDGGRYGVAAQIPAHIVWPQESTGHAATRNTLVYFHGGGFVVGDLDSHHMHAVRLANEAGCVVVNVDYRLAPEHRFPAAFDDSLAAIRWAVDHIAELGGDASRLAVGGDSAGGNLAAALALACRDAGIALAAQLLLYPATNLNAMKGMPEKAYLGEENLDTLPLDWRASPFFAASHAGLAPAILAVGAHDFLFQDNLAYRDKLQAAGNALTYREYPTLNHGFYSYTAISPDSLAAAQQISADLKAAFEAA